MPIAAQAFFVAYGGAKSLAEGNAHIFHRVVAVDMQITCAGNIQIDQAVACNLVEHMVKKADARVELGQASAV